MTDQVDTSKALSIFSVISNNGSGVWLLFMDSLPLDHDILVTNFIRTFETSDEAMRYYNERYKNSDDTGLIAKFDGINLSVVYRWDKHYYTDSGGWYEARDYGQE